jgi:hypothetical protein
MPYLATVDSTLQLGISAKVVGTTSRQTLLCFPCGIKHASVPLSLQLICARCQSNHCSRLWSLSFCTAAHELKFTLTAEKTTEDGDCPSICQAFKRLWEGPSTLSLCPPNYCTLYRARVCKHSWSPGLDSEKSIPPAYVAWRAGAKNRVVVLARQTGNRFPGSLKGLQIRALCTVERIEVTHLTT